MDAASARPGRWNPTEEDFARFLAALSPDRDQAALQYEGIRSKLITFFRQRGFWDTEVLADETIDRTIKRLGEIEIKEVKAFVLGVARRVASEGFTKRGREVPLDSLAQIPSVSESEGRWTQLLERRLDSLEKCLAQLSPAEQQLISQYYLYAKAQKIETKRLMAESLGISLANLRVRAFRLRQQLERCVKHRLDMSAGS